MLQRASHPEFLGVCFDLAHVFASGYDLRGYSGYKKVLGEFDRIVGVGKIGAFHLNDSQTELGARNDRHACVPMVLEIPEREEKSRENLDLLRKLQVTPCRGVTR